MNYFFAAHFNGYVGKYDLDDYSYYLYSALNSNQYNKIKYNDGILITKESFGSKKLFRYNPNDLTVLNSCNFIGDGTEDCFECNANYIWNLSWSGDTNYALFSLYDTNLNLQKTIHISGYGTHGAIINDGNYIYLANQDVNIKKIDNELNTVIQSSDLIGGGIFRYMVIDENYIYAWKDSKIYKFLKSDLSLIEISNNLVSNVQGTIINYEYIYVYDTSGIVYKINKNTLLIVDSHTNFFPDNSVGSISANNNVLIIGSSNTYKPKIYDVYFNYLGELINAKTETYGLTINRDYAVIPAMPSGLTATTISYHSIDIQWVNNSFVGKNVVQIYSDNTWNDVAILEISATTYQLTKLIRGIEYIIRISDRYNSIDYPSDSITIRTLDYPPSFCEQGQSYLLTVSAATCGNFDGTIILNNPNYLQFYDLIIEDSFSNYYFDDDPYSPTYGESQPLFAGWYHIQAIPKPEYYDYYDGISCKLMWINVPDSDTTLLLQNIVIKNAICSGFGKRKGRIAYYVSGTTGHQYDAYFFKENGEGNDADLIETKDTISDINPVIFSNLDGGKYYAILYDQDNGCILNLGGNIVDAITANNVAGISKLYVTKFDTGVEVNYWSEADEDYYLSGIDPNFFNSIKIKEFIDLPGSWYEIPLINAHATYGQTMNKTTQGFIFTDTVSITIPQADNAKWLNLVNFLHNKHIVVMKDDNNNIWTMGYKYGAETDEYKMNDNNYILTINAKSDNKIMTALDKNYYKNYIK